MSNQTVDGVTVMNTTVRVITCGSEGNNLHFFVSKTTVFGLDSVNFALFSRGSSRFSSENAPFSRDFGLLSRNFALFSHDFAMFSRDKGDRLLNVASGRLSVVGGQWLVKAGRVEELRRECGSRIVDKIFRGAPPAVPR